MVLILFLLAKIARPKVSKPSLPTNITKMMTIFPQELKLPVMPVLKPTVPMADVVSKRIWSRGRSSVMANKNVERKITDA